MSLASQMTDIDAAIDAIESRLPDAPGLRAADAEVLRRHGDVVPSSRQLRPL